MITVKDLRWDEIKRNICGHCGACTPHCEWEKCQGQTEDSRLGTCDICYLFCPRSSLSGINKGFVRNIDSIHKDFDKLVDVKGCPVMTSFSARSIKNDEKESHDEKESLNMNVQDGGFVTTLLKFLLREKRIDAAVVVKRTEEWEPIPFIATTETDIEIASGSKYTISPVLSVLKEATDKYEKVAFVGVPCQIRTLKNMRLQNDTKNLNLDRVKIAIGLFCRENFSYEGLKEFVRNKGIDIREVKKFDISAGKFKIYVSPASSVLKSEDSNPGITVTEVPIKELHNSVWPICHACLDFTSEFADISVGSVGSKKGCNTVLVRSEEGHKLVGDLTERNLVTIEKIETEKFSWVYKLTEDKRKNMDRLTLDVKNILYS